MLPQCCQYDSALEVLLVRTTLYESLFLLAIIIIIIYDFNIHIKSIEVLHIANHSLLMYPVSHTLRL